MFRVNAVGVAAMTREAAAVMNGRRRDRQRRARSRASSRRPNHSHYAAAKAAVDHAHARGALELGGRGIRVNCVSPGLIDVARPRRDVAGAASSAGTRRRRSHRLGTPADVADAVLFLASPAARWITGANLVVDGGVLAHSTW